MSPIKIIKTFWTQQPFLWMVMSGSSTLPSFYWASKKASHPSQLTREDRSRYGSESTPKTAGHTWLPHIGFLKAKYERCQLFCLSRRYYLTRVAYWARWMGFIDHVSSNWTARSHVGGKGGVFRLDSLHYTFIMISLPDATQNVFTWQCHKMSIIFLDPTARDGRQDQDWSIYWDKSPIQWQANYTDNSWQISKTNWPAAITESLTGSWMFGKWVPSCLLYLLHPKSCFPYYAWSCFN